MSRDLVATPLGKATVRPVAPITGMVGSAGVRRVSEGEVGGETRRVPRLGVTSGVNLYEKPGPFKNQG